MKSRRTTHSAVGRAFGALFSQRRCLATVIAVVNVALVPVASGQSVVIEAGSDAWLTAIGTTFSFGLQPIPADFFGPGSDPFDGTVNLAGAPLETNPPGALGPADTVVERLVDTAPLDVGDSSGPIAIEILALSLVSTDPITVTFNGGQDPEEWDVRVCLSLGGQSQGSMTITRATPDGGTFDATFPVVPLFVFTGPGGTLELDCAGFCDLQMGGQGNAWVLIDGPGGITRAQLGAVEFEEVQVNSDCDAVPVFDVTTLGVSKFQGGLSDTGGGGAECVVNEEAENQAQDPPVMTGVHKSFYNTPQDMNNNGIPDKCEGACCAADGTCSIKANFQCEEAGMTYLGNETICEPNMCGGPVPTVSEWGLIVMALLLLTAGTIVFGRRRRLAVA